MKILTIYMADCCDKMFNTAEECRTHEKEHWKYLHELDEFIRKCYLEEDDGTA